MEREMTEPEEPKRKEMLRRLQLQHDEIISGVGLVTRAWATLESGLFELFRLLARLSTPSPGPEIAGVIFYTPTNTETRISLVDNLIAYHCQMMRIGELDDRLVDLWSKKVKGKINNLKNTRNSIVHGTIVTSSKGGMDQRMRLSPTFGETLRFLPFARAHEHPGIGPNELRVHEKAVWRVIERTQKLTQAFALRMQVRFGPHQGGEVQELLELLTRLEHEMNSQNIPDQEQQDKTDLSQSFPK
jgi:hypothetical protein